MTSRFFESRGQHDSASPHLNTLNSVPVSKGGRPYGTSPADLFLRFDSENEDNCSWEHNGPRMQQRRMISANASSSPRFFDAFIRELKRW